jgi:hypothetical protein
MWPPPPNHPAQRPPRMASLAAVPALSNLRGYLGPAPAMRHSAGSVVTRGASPACLPRSLKIPIPSHHAWAEGGTYVCAQRICDACAHACICDLRGGISPPRVPAPRAPSVLRLTPRPVGGHAAQGRVRVGEAALVRGKGDLPWKGGSSHLGRGPLGPSCRILVHRDWGDDSEGLSERFVGEGDGRATSMILKVYTARARPRTAGACLASALHYARGY